MLDTQGLSLLMGDKPVTPEIAFRLIDLRLARMKSHLDYLPAKRFGQLKLVDSAYHCTIENDSPEVVSRTELSLRTFGAFSLFNKREEIGSDSDNRPQSIVYGWGLTRAGEWLLGKILYTRIDLSTLRAVRIELEGLTPAGLWIVAHVQPKEVLRLLSELMDERRRWLLKQYEGAVEIVAANVAEDSLLRSRLDSF